MPGPARASAADRLPAPALPAADPRLPALGCGLGLRVEHYSAILEQAPPVDWLEILSENYLVPGGRPLHYLEQFRARYPVVMHGVSLSIGSVEPLNRAYLGELKALAARIEPEWISDHLCWTGVDGINLHDMLPLPYTEEALAHVVARVGAVQDLLGRRLVLENVSSYIGYTCAQMSEWEFLDELARRADCLLLLDVNNVYVSARNHGFDPLHFLHGIDPQRVQQLHIAGHDDEGDLVIDTHDAAVRAEVWDLLAATYQRFGAVSTLIERDDKVPPLATLVDELDHARSIAAQYLSRST